MSTKRLTREEVNARIDPEKIRKYGVSFEECLARELKNPEFKKAYEEEILKYQIADKVRETRKSKHISQVKLAKEAETTQRIISDIEKGKINIGVKLLQKIMTALGLKIQIS